MKKLLFFILLILSVNITAVVYGMEPFAEKVTYTHTAQSVPSRISIVMVPKAKSESFADSDICGMTGSTFHDEGAHTLDILPRTGTPSGEYTLIINADGVKSTLDIQWLTTADKKIYDALKAINGASEQKLEKVIREHIDLMSKDFTMKEYDSLHKDDRTTVMKRLARNYTFATLEAFEKAFNKEVSDVNEPSPGGNSSSSSSSTGGLTPLPPLPAVVPTPQAPAKQTFNDLSGYGWATDAINNLSDKGIVSGDGSGNFMPQNKVTRAEFSAMIVRLMGIADNTATVTFDDVRENDWFYVYVASAKKAGIISGRSETQFSPADNITRAEAVIMIHNVLKSKNCDFSGEGTGNFADISALDDLTREKISQTASIGVIEGRDESTFAPYDNLTRAEAAVIINRIIKYI